LTLPLTPDDRPRLRWRCRRGMKELDLLLTRWLERQFDDASEGQRALFERLLELPDPQLASYLVAGESPEAPELAALIQAIRTGQSIRTGTRIMSSPGREP
jgi:antitoxin CptB